MSTRFMLDRLGVPAVVIMSVRNFIRLAAPPPDWLQKSWSGAKRRGLEALAPADADAEIGAHRRSKKSALRPGVRAKALQAAGNIIARGQGLSLARVHSNDLVDEGGSL